MVKRLALIAVALGCVSSTAGLRATRVSGPQPGAEWLVVEGWPRLPPGFQLGEVSGVGVDSRGHVLVFHRAGGHFDREATAVISAPTVLELEPVAGQLINSWGAGLFIVPHSLTVDRNDNVWVTDDRLHQVLKFSHDGRLLMTVGQRGIPGWDGSHFNEPTDVVVLDDGSFLVSDGYQNARIARFDGRGGFVREWGAKGVGPGQFQIPHGAAIDRRGHVYVADRQNSRLQVFDTAGRFLTEWPAVPSPGRVFDVVVSDGGSIYLTRKDGLDAIVVLDRSFNEISRIPFDSTRNVTPHAIAVQGDSIIYLADTGGQRITKFVRR